MGQVLPDWAGIVVSLAESFSFGNTLDRFIAEGWVVL